MCINWDKPLQTNDGRPVRLICYDRKTGNHPQHYNYVVLIENADGIETTFVTDQYGIGPGNISIKNAPVIRYLALHKMETGLYHVTPPFIERSCAEKFRYPSGKFIKVIEVDEME